LEDGFISESEEAFYTGNLGFFRKNALEPITQDDQQLEMLKVANDRAAKEIAEKNIQKREAKRQAENLEQFVNYYSFPQEERKQLEKILENINARASELSSISVESEIGREISTRLSQYRDFLEGMKQSGRRYDKILLEATASHIDNQIVSGAIAYGALGSFITTITWTALGIRDLIYENKKEKKKKEQENKSNGSDGNPEETHI